MTSPLNSKKSSTGNLWLLIAVLMFLMLLLLGYQFKYRFAPDVSAIATLDKSCDLHKGECWSDLPSGGQVSFAINPKSIPVLQPLEFTVEIRDINVATISVDLVGINMDMGYNHVNLERMGKNLFKGTSIIPICVRDKMEWEARVFLQKDQTLLMAPFRFYTLK